MSLRLLLRLAVKCMTSTARAVAPQLDATGIVLLVLLRRIRSFLALSTGERDNGPVDGFSCSMTGSNDYKDSADSDVVVITAGLARNFYTSTLSNHWGFATGYRLGLAYGYEEGEAPFSNVSPIVPIAELYAQCIYRGHFGVEIMLTSSLSFSFFYQF